MSPFLILVTLLTATQRFLYFLDHLHSIFFPYMSSEILDLSIEEGAWHLITNTKKYFLLGD